MLPSPSHTADLVVVDVRTPSAPYSISIGSGVARRLRSMLDGAGLVRRVVVSNATVWRIHSDLFSDITSEEPVLIPDGERFKNLSTISRIYDGLIRANADRATTIVAVGGGVVGDVAGFAAATYLRGVPLVHVPTTLLAQVDSSIGGKVGVNHPLGKNLIGAFYQPAAVAIDIDVLETLPRREFRSGLYEVLKYGVIASRALFDRLRDDLQSLFARERGPLLHVVAESCRIKARIVEGDEREAGARRSLNFGHTIGHALEAVTKYRRFRHGEAIGYGMLVAAEVSVARGLMPSSDRDALLGVITQMGPLPPVSDLNPTEILEAVGRDKKIVGGKLHFVLTTGIGQTITADDVSSEELTRALAAIRPAP